MEKMAGCMYCEKNDTLNNLMIWICELPYSNVYLFKNQAYRGRCVVAYKNHADELFELSDENLCGFMEDTKRVCHAIAGVVQPEKMNLGMYGDTCKHVHWHVVPKQKGGTDFGTTFQMQPQPPVFLQEEEYTELINQIKTKL
ncbi:MAG: HIT family protein [Clostridium sp.]